MQYVAPYPANVITSDVTGQFASVAALNATGLYLYGLITSSGGGSSSAELALTGSILSSRVDSLSGYVALSDSGLSGFLQNQISNSGAGLNNKIDSLSGYSNATFATQSRIDLTGQALSQNLYLTGSNLFVLITGSSGYAALVYATKTNLEQTGSNLQAQIDGLQGAQFITTGAADQRYVNLTASQLISGAKTFRTPIRVNNIVNDGLVINIDGISGTYAGYGGAGPEINLFASSLKNLIGQTTLDWGQRVLSGNWGTDGIVLNGFSLVNWSQLVNTSGNISIVLTETGSILNNKINSLSGYANSTFSTITRVANTGSVLDDKINSLSGANLQYISGVSGALNNLIQGSAGGVSSINGQSGILSIVGAGNISVTTGANTITVSGNTGAYANFATATNLALTGSNLFTTLTDLSGDFNTQIASTGQQAWSATNNNGINLSGNLAQTGEALILRDLAISGGLEIRLAVTGAASTTLTLSVGQALSGNLALTGQQAWTAANNNAINLSGSLTQTGVALINRDNSISGVLQTAINAINAGTGSLTTNVVFTTGVQLIGGTKYFVGNTYIDNLYVTGSQFVVNTQDLYVGENWIVMNATGGARDSALFISTGITGVNATGAILGLDVPSNTWRFGFGSQQTDLINLPRIASGEAIDVLDVRLTQSGVNLRNTIENTGASAWNAANNNSINLSGNLAQTGIALLARDLATSGVVDSKINSLSGYTNTLYGNNILYTSGNQNIAGIKSFNSGAFTGRLSASGTSGDYAMIVQSFQGVTGAKGLKVSAGTVAGDDALLVTNALGTTLVRIDGVGQLGIGTASPTQALHVVGNILLTGNVTVGSGIVGAQASPPYIIFGTSYSSGSTRDGCKIYLYNDGGTEKYGFGVGSAGDIQYHSNGNHDLYIANSRIVRINSSSLAVTGAISATTGLSLIGTVTSIRTASNLTNATTKETRWVAAHYLLAEEDMMVLYPFSDSTTNTIAYGGGAAANNAATRHDFYVAANNITVSGTLVTSITSTGLSVTGNLAFAGAPSFVAGSIYLNATNGLTIAGKTGATNDFLLTNNAGSTVLRNPTGGMSLATGGDLIVNGSLNISNSTAYANITSTTGTQQAYLQINNTGGTYYLAADNSAGSALGFGAYNMGVYVPSSRNFSFYIVGTGVVGAFSSTGLAVVGNITATNASGGGGFSIIRTGVSPSTFTMLNTGGEIIHEYNAVGYGFNISTTRIMTLASTGLTVTGAAGITSFTGSTQLGVRVVGATSTTDYSGIDFSTGTQIARARVASYFTASGSYLVLGTSNNYATGITNSALTIDYTGAVTLSSSLLVTGGASIGVAALQVIGNQANQLIANLTTSITTAGQSFGLRVAAGTNASDYALRVSNQAGTLDYLYVKGDGAVSMGNGLSVTGSVTLSSTSNRLGLGGAAPSNWGIYNILSHTGDSWVAMGNGTTWNPSANGQTTYGIYSQPTYAKSTFTGLFAWGIFMNTPSVSGSGTIGSAAHIYMASMGGIATNNYGIYQGGTELNVFNGSIGCADKIIASANALDVSSSNAGFRVANPITATPTISVGAISSSQTMLQFVNTNGTVGSIQTSGTATSYNTSSDYRLKTNIRDIVDSGKIIDALTPRLFDWKTGDKDTYGFIAQEAYKIYPQMVTRGDDHEEIISKRWSIDPSKLIPVLTAEIKSLRERLAKLENLN